MDGLQPPPVPPPESSIGTHLVYIQPMKQEVMGGLYLERLLNLVVRGDQGVGCNYRKGEYIPQNGGASKHFDFGWRVWVDNGLRWCHVLLYCPFSAHQSLCDGNWRAIAGHFTLSWEGHDGLKWWKKIAMMRPYKNCSLKLTTPQHQSILPVPFYSCLLSSPFTRAFHDTNDLKRN